MSLSAWEQQSLDSIRDGLTGSDPELSALLITFTRLTAGEEMPARATLRARSRRAIQRSRLRSRYAVLAWLLVTMVMISTALTLSRGNGDQACPRSTFGAVCASAAPAPGPPFPGWSRPVPG